METIDHYDGVFFISSCLNAKVKNVYSPKVRFAQTLETIYSIDKYCPKNIKILHDTSTEPMDQKYIDFLGSEKVTIVYTGQNPTIQQLSNAALTSATELFSTIITMNWFNENIRNNITALRAYKISGRYKLNDNFILHDERFANAFVHNMTVDSYMPMERRQQTGAFKAYGTRLVHWDYNLMDTYMNELPKMFEDCVNFGIDAEHAYWKHLHTYNNVDLPKVGVEGWIAPLGIYEDD
jgi:hypothetical protein